jgi:hypothetical protein
MKNKWLLVILSILLSCHSGKQDNTMTNSGSIKDTSLTSGSLIAPAFWDSISKQLKLSDDQMAKYTILDTSTYKIGSFYSQIYSDSSIYADWGMYGDSAYNTRNLKVAILKYSDGVCLKKYMLVFDSTGKHNLSYTMIEEGCDRDGENSPYSSQEYKILTDSTFETIETSDPGDADTTDRNITTEITKWKITNKGMIDSLRGKIRRKEPKD